MPLDASPVIIEINGGRYMTVGLPSGEDSWSYYFSVPLNKFTEGNGLYAALFAAVLCLSLFTGIVMSLYFSRRLSHPIREIMDTLRLNTALDYPEAVSSLEGALLSYRKEMALKQDQTARNSRLKKAGFVYGLCTGRISLDKLNEGIERYGLPLGVSFRAFYNGTDLQGQFSVITHLSGVPGTET